nr:phenylacetyl-CoA:acceptor oxidoreductase [uncultured crenarchaeote]
MARQSVWGWPAWANFFLGGAGASLYIMGRIAAADTAAVRGLDVLALLLVLCGLVAVYIEAGKRMRAIYAFRGAWTRMGHRSWMSREAIAATVFILAGAMDLVADNTVFDIVALTAAAVYLVSQSLIPSSARLIPAWSNNAMPVLMLVTSLMAGTGLALIISPIAPQLAATVNTLTFSLVKTGTAAGTVVLPTGLESGELVRVIAAASILVAVFYAYFPGSTVHFRHALRHDGNYLFYALFVLLGGVAPLLMSSDVFGGVLLVLGSAGLKYVVLIRMSYKLDPISYLAELLSPPRGSHQIPQEPLDREGEQPP